jgi:ABC-type multidrug transport system ATPase subunit
MNSPIIKVGNLCKRFNEVTAVDDLSFTVKEAAIYGFLGQNGAGKSTTIRMLLGLVRPDSGRIEMFGMDLRQHRREILQQVGAIIERPDLYKFLSGFENLRLFASMNRLKLSRQTLMDQLALVGLADRAHSKVRTYSQGMKQRLGIAVALVHDPRLVILDEPTNGLDPQGIADMRNLILHLRHDKGKTVFVSSHLLSEIEQVADSMLIIDKGKQLVEGPVDELFSPSNMIAELMTTDNEEAWNKIKASPYSRFLHSKTEDAIFLKIHREEIPGMVRNLVEMDIAVVSLHSRHSLEEYFLSLTGKPNVAAFTN